MKVIIILLINSINLINCVDNEVNVIKPEFTPIEQKWIKTFDQIFNSFKQLADNYRPTVEESLLEVNISSKCSQSIRQLLSNTDEEWVLSSKWSLILN